MRMMMVIIPETIRTMKMIKVCRVMTLRTDHSGYESDDCYHSMSAMTTTRQLVSCTTTGEDYVRYFSCG